MELTANKNAYIINTKLRGGVKFPTGGIVREQPSWLLIWCNSKTDSIVWMGEDGQKSYSVCDFRVYVKAA